MLQPSKVTPPRAPDQADQRVPTEGHSAPDTSRNQTAATVPACHQLEADQPIANYLSWARPLKKGTCVLADQGMECSAIW